MTVTTHVHWDHIGGHKYFDNIAVHEAEKDWLSVRFPIPLQVVKNNLTRLPCDFPRDFDINAYQIFQGIPQRILHDGDFLNLGGREIQVVHTPGHSPGHCCFYEPERNYLYSGDLIYNRPEAILSIYKANSEIQYKKSSARTPSVGYSRFFDSRY